MTTYEIEFHKVSSLPSNKDNYRGHVFFNDATNEPIIETTTDEEGKVIKKRQHERGIYLCAYNEEGKLDYISYTMAGAGDNNIGMDIDTLNDRITLWASKFQKDIQNLAKLTADSDQILAQVKKFYNELNYEVTGLQIKSDQIETNVAEYVNGVKEQYSQVSSKADGINAKVEKLGTDLAQVKLAQVEMSADGIIAEVEKLRTDLAQVKLSAEELRTSVRTDISNLDSRISQTAGKISHEVNDKINNVKAQIVETSNQIKLEVSNDLDSAYILTKINGDDSEVKIKADKITFDGAAIARSLSLESNQSETEKLFDQYKDYVVGDLRTSLDDLKKQVDDTIDNWYYEHYPVDWSDASANIASNNISYNTENNISQETVERALKQSTEPKEDVEPYASWLPKDGKDDTRPIHIGDTFTNTNFQQENNDVRDGRTWKFCATVDSDGNYTDYRWEPMSDSAAAAMRSIADLEDQVSNKRQVFINTPTPPYDKGDLWIIMKSAGGKTSGENIFVCITPKSATETFSNTDWISTNDFVGKNILDAEIDKTKNELVKQIKDEVSEVDLRKVLEDGGFIERENGTYVPASGLLSEYTDANGVTTLTMQVGGGAPITWQKTVGKDAKGNEFLAVNTPWGSPDKSSFVVSKEGLLEAHNAVIYGKIFAGAGEIGGIKIHDNDISSSNGNFSVTNKGELFAKNARIEGTITATSLKIGADVTIPQGNIYGLTTDLNSAKSTADSAKSTADSAKSTADSAKSTADSAKSTADSAKSAADSASITATNAKSTADSAKSTADSAVTTANSASDTANSAVTIATNASNAANSANNNYVNLQGQLNDLQEDVAGYLAGNKNISDWISRAFSQTMVDGGLMLSGNVFVADNGGYITAGMMGASAVDASKTPRFFAGDPKNNITSSNTDLSPGNIYGNADTPNYPFVVTADGSLYASKASLTGSLNITRNGKNYDIGEYVIGKMTEDNKLNVDGTVTGAIDTLNTEVFGPAMTKAEIEALDRIKKEEARPGDEDLIKAYNRNVITSNYLIGRIFRAEGKIAALQSDISALRSGSISDTNVAFICSNCWGKFIYKASEGLATLPSIPPIKPTTFIVTGTTTYGDVNTITCPTCGSIAYKGLAVNSDTGNEGSIVGGGSGDDTGLIEDGGDKIIADRPITRPGLPIDFVDTSIDKPGTEVVA